MKVEILQYDPEGLINITRLIPMGHRRTSRPKQSFHLLMLEYDFELGVQKQKYINFYFSDLFTSVSYW